VRNKKIAEAATIALENQAIYADSMLTKKPGGF
jgi:hypothetical protein